MECAYKARFRNYRPSVITFYNEEGNILLREPSLVAIDTQETLQAVGNDAQKLEDHQVFIVGSPLRRGIVADFDLATSLFKTFLKKISGLNGFIRPNIAVCVPIEMTDVETRALKEMIVRIGGRNVLVVEEPFERAIQVIPPKYKIIIEISPDM